MKARTMIIVLVSILLLPTVLFAQQCLGVTLIEGSGYEMLTYDGRGKENGVIIYKIKKVSQQGDETLIDIEFESFDKKGKSTLTNTYQMKCSGSELKMDASVALAGEQSESFQNFDMQFTSTDMVYPANLTLGQTLPDASLHGEGAVGPMNMTIDTRMVNRKVVAKEQVSVPAGTFDAYKITMDINMDMKSVIKASSTFGVVSYRTNDILWDIKNETYRNGKLIGTTVLNKILK